MQLKIHSLIVRESWFQKLCHLRNRIKLPYFNKITPDRTPEDRPKKFYSQEISTYWNDPQGHLIHHQFSTCKTFLINV
jgi:hypothetical protein